MIRKNPRGDLPHIDESAYVDQTAILCGKILIEENVFVGPYAVIRGFYVSSTLRIGPQPYLSTIPRVQQAATDFSEDAVRTNHELVQGDKKLQKEF